MRPHSMGRLGFYWIDDMMWQYEASLFNFTKSIEENDQMLLLSFLFPLIWFVVMAMVTNANGFYVHLSRLATLWVDLAKEVCCYHYRLKSVTWLVNKSCQTPFIFYFLWIDTLDNTKIQPNRWIHYRLYHPWPDNLV